VSVVVNEFEVVPEPAAPAQAPVRAEENDTAEVERRLEELARRRALRAERLRAT
jgi:hypothetical protein